MRPGDFADYVRRIAGYTGVPLEQVSLGGDHLGPSVWQGEPAESAMGKAEELVREYVGAGFVKIHLDCSMRLADDPLGPLDREVSARRAARLAGVAERLPPEAGTSPRAGPRYVIGSEVPIPGGALQDEETVGVTSVESARESLGVTREAFLRGGLGSAWERVIALVVQPGIEFGDDFVLPYRSASAQELSGFIEDGSMVYEAHSTDYQTRAALGELVRDHFAILKVGPRLTFAFREAIFALALIEAELVRPEERSNILQVIEEAMLRSPVYWEKYYRGDAAEQAFKRKFSLSDRIRYYWPDPQVDQAVQMLLRNLDARPIPAALLSQFVPVQSERIRLGELPPTPSAIILDHIQAALGDYHAACNPRA
jgi:D-tagatose-1,6-bisphosphate aldolase subunit GatZ/KbaZ